ncbi:MAG: OsmC family protein [Gemmatimonadota bacterium]|nr:OsmC family protein [Gemmatimonadota bacterium]
MNSNRHEHKYTTQVEWTGNLGRGTGGYRTYSRDHIISVAGKPDIAGSADPAFRGDPAHYNPEELLVASLSACHMLWYLHLCAEAGVVVREYSDRAEGMMAEASDGGGRFEEVVLRPVVLLEQGNDSAMAERLHARAHSQCFIAGSVNFTVRCEAVIRIGVLA